MPKDTGKYHNPIDKGAAAELFVCVDLMRKGCRVFRAVSPAGPYDLVADCDGIPLRVQVRSSTAGNPDSMEPGREYDLFAQVRGDGSIWYRPPWPLGKKQKYIRSVEADLEAWAVRVRCLNRIDGTGFGWRWPTDVPSGSESQT